MSDGARQTLRVLKTGLFMSTVVFPHQIFDQAQLPFLDGHVEKTGPWTERVYRKVGGWGPFGGELETEERRRHDTYYGSKEYRDSLTPEDIEEIRRGFGLDGC